jgi:hypothetical protein
MAQWVSSNILKIQFSNKKTDLVFKMTHLRVYGRKIISRHFQLVKILYQKLDFHGISRFFAVSSSIISMLGGTIQEPWIQKVNLCFPFADPTKKPNISISLLESQFLFACASKIL